MGYIPENVELTKMQEAFCQAYVCTAPFYSAQEAALQAGYSASIAKDATRILRSEAVAARIQELRDETAMRNHITIDDIINQLCKIAFFDPRTLYYEDGTAKPITELDPIAAAAVAGFDVEELQISTPGGGKMKIGEKFKYRMKDGLAAMQQLTTALGYLPKQKIVRRNAAGEIVETESVETEIPQHTVIFKKFSAPQLPAPDESNKS